MKKTATLIILALLTIALGANAQGHRRWNFTNWSQQTISNLQAEAAQERPAKGWSDIEKMADNVAGATAPEATKEKCFWLEDENGQWLTDPDGGFLKANGVVIAETEGLVFNPAYTLKRSLAIAVDYPKTGLGEYAGPQYLWLGGGSQNLACFTIPNVPVGEKITMTVESHKPTDARGVELYVGSVSAENKIGESFKPKTRETFTWEDWELPEGIEEAATVDIIVYNTSGCHIYDIEVGEDTGEEKTPVALLYNGDLQADVAYRLLSGNGQFHVTPIEAGQDVTLDALREYSTVVVSATVSDDALLVLKDIRPFVPMLNFNPRAYEVWGLGKAVATEINFAVVSNADHALFKNLDLVPSDEDENVMVLPLSVGPSIYGVQLEGVFADDAVLARPLYVPELVAIHTHNASHNGYLFIPFTQEVLAQVYAPEIIDNAIALLSVSKAAITKAPKPSITLDYKRLNTDITLKSGVTGAKIFYTLDGSTPTEESTLYTEPLNVTAECTVKAVALGDGYLLSDVAEMTVGVKDMATAPVISVETEATKATVTITAADDEAEIWFNLIGSSDKARSQLYTEPFTLTGDAQVAAFVAGNESLLSSETVVRNVTLSGVVTYNEQISKFEGNSFGTFGNGLNSGFNYYTDEVIESQTYKDVNGEDSIVNTYARRDSLVIIELSDDWHVKTYGQGLYYTKATIEHKVGSASGYNPATVFDDQRSAGEATNNAMQFQVVSKKDGDGRLNPVSVALESKRAFGGPFEVAVYYSGKDTNAKHVLDVLVSTDTLRADGWQKIGELQSVDQVYLDGTADKSFRVWKRGTVLYSAAEPVFVKLAAVEGAKDVNLFTVVVNGPGVSENISQRSMFNVQCSMVYDLQGRAIKNGQWSMVN